MLRPNVAEVVEQVKRTIKIVTEQAIKFVSTFPPSSAFAGPSLLVPHPTAACPSCLRTRTDAVMLSFYVGQRRLPHIQIRNVTDILHIEQRRCRQWRRRLPYATLVHQSRRSPRRDEARCRGGHVRQGHIHSTSIVQRSSQARSVLRIQWRGHSRRTSLLFITELPVIQYVG